VLALALAAVALAAPPLPVLAEEGSALGLGALARADTDSLVDPACGGEGCEALRSRVNIGGFAQGQLYPWLGGYAAVSQEQVSTPAAFYAAEGIALDAGIVSSLWARREQGLVAWAHFTAASAGSADATRSSRYQVEAGAAARLGTPGGGLLGFAGGNVLLFGDDELHILSGSVPIPLVPALPVEAVGGVVVTSEPLGSFDSASRLMLSADIRLGARNGVGLALGLTL